jgi:hypothetical protein
MLYGQTFFKFKDSKNIANAFFPEENGVMALYYEDKPTENDILTNIDCILRVNNGEINLENSLFEKNDLLPKMEVNHILFNSSLITLESLKMKLNQYGIKFKIIKNPKDFGGFKYKFDIIEPMILGDSNFIKPTLSEEVMDLINSYNVFKQFGYYDDREYNRISNNKPYGRFHIFDKEYKGNHTIPGFILYFSIKKEKVFHAERDYFESALLEDMETLILKVKDLSNKLNLLGIETYFTINNGITMSGYVKTKLIDPKLLKS